MRGRRAGSGGLISLLHCEDYALVEEATNRLLAAGRTSIRHYAASRPVVAEVLATQGAVASAEATNAARLFGPYRRKGHIGVGSDADLVVFDPHLTRTIASSTLKSNADYSSYEGWEVTGWPLVTVRHGQIVFRDEEITARPGSGELVSREATAPL